MQLAMQFSGIFWMCIEYHRETSFPKHFSSWILLLKSMKQIKFRLGHLCVNTDSSRMVFIPKDFGNVPGNVNFLQASTIGAVTKSQARSGVLKKKVL